MTTTLTSPSHRPNNIVAIASGKGGVGKTWLSITLAHVLARSGRRILLFDGDIGLANVDVQLGLTPERDMGAVFFGGKRLQDVVIRHEDGGFDIIAGRSGSASLASLSMERLQIMQQQMFDMAAQYDLVIIDLGAGVEQYVQFLSSIASRCLVVVTDEPTSLTDAYAFIKLCSSNPHMPEQFIVVNQATTQKEGEMTFGALNKACVSFLKVSPPLLGIIRKDNKVKDAIRSQKSILVKSPHCTAATDVAALAVKLMSR